MDPKSGVHFWDPSDALSLKQRIVRRGKPGPLFRTMLSHLSWRRTACFVQCERETLRMSAKALGPPGRDHPLPIDRSEIFADQNGRGIEDFLLRSGTEFQPLGQLPALGAAFRVRGALRSAKHDRVVQQECACRLG